MNKEYCCYECPKEQSNGWSWKHKGMSMLFYPGEEIPDDYKIYHFECDYHKQVRKEQFLGMLQGAYDKAEKKILMYEDAK